MSSGARAQDASSGEPPVLDSSPYLDSQLRTMCHTLRSHAAATTPLQQKAAREQRSTVLICHEYCSVSAFAFRELGSPRAEAVAGITSDDRVPPRIRVERITRDPVCYATQMLGTEFASVHCTGMMNAMKRRLSRYSNAARSVDIDRRNVLPAPG